MSNHVSSEVYKRQIGSLARTAILALLADKASDDGSGIWASKQTIAEELGTTKRTVITIMQEFVDEGLLVVTGKHPIVGGHTVVYKLDVEALQRLPLTPHHQKKANAKGCSSVTSEATSPVKQNAISGEAASPKPLNHSSEPKGSSETRAKPKTKTPKAKFAAPHGVTAQQWTDFLTVRKQKRSPLTPSAYKQILNKIEAGAARGVTAEQLFNTALERGWSTIFLPDDDRSRSPPAKPDSRTYRPGTIYQ